MGMTYRVLRQMLKRWKWTSEEIADALCRSQSNIRHRLQEEGTNIQTLRERARRRMMANHLRQGSSAELIAWELGFAGVKSFYPYFQQVMGMRWMEWKRANNY